MLLHDGFPEASELWKSTSGQIQDGARFPNSTYLNRNYFTIDCSIFSKFGTEFNHVSADTLKTFKVKRSKVKVPAWRNVSAVKSLQLAYVSNGSVDRIQTWWKSPQCGAQQSDPCSRLLDQVYTENRNVADIWSVQWKTPVNVVWSPNYWSFQELQVA